MRTSTQVLDFLSLKLHAPPKLATYALSTMHTLQPNSEITVTQTPQPIHEIASGEINVWVDPGGAICIKIRNEFDDPAELADHEAIELAELLLALVKANKSE